jgi:hypothetical protein
MIRHSGAMQSIEPAISRFPDAQLRICGLVRSLSSGRAPRGPVGTTRNDKGWYATT